MAKAFFNVYPGYQAHAPWDGHGSSFPLRPDPNWPGHFYWPYADLDAADAYKEAMGEEAFERQWRPPGREPTELIGVGPALPRASRAPPLVAAARFLEDRLFDGEWHTATWIKAEAEAGGHAWRTVKRAKSLLGVETARRGFGPGGSWEWRLQVKWLPARQVLMRLAWEQKKGPRPKKTTRA